MLAVYHTAKEGNMILIDALTNFYLPFIVASILFFIIIILCACVILCNKEKK